MTEEPLFGRYLRLVSSAGTYARYLGHFLSFSGTVSIEDAMNLDSLLISRDADLLGVLRPTLENISVNVEVCEGFRAGNDLLAKRKFDAVIVDCDDLQNGFDLLRRQCGEILEQEGCYACSNRRGHAGT